MGFGLRVFRILIASFRRASVSLAAGRLGLRVFPILIAK